MKNIHVMFHSWFSCLSWQLGPSRWWLIGCLAVTFGCASLAMYWQHEASLIDQEIESVFKKIKNKRLLSQQPNSVNVANKSANLASNASLSIEQESLMELRLPPVSATKASPLGKYLSETKLKGVVIKQVDYVWAKSTKNLSQNFGVGRIEVNLTMEGNYPSVRAWLGELLYEESNIQINSIQFQRLARDSLTINSAISLSVYFQEAK